MNVFPESDCFSPSPSLLSWSEPLISLSRISAINLPNWSSFFRSWPLDSLFSTQQLGRTVKTQQAGHISSSAQSPAWLQFSLRIKAKELKGTIWPFIICLPIPSPHRPITSLTSDFYPTLLIPCSLHFSHSSPFAACWTWFACSFLEHSHWLVSLPRRSLAQNIEGRFSYLLQVYPNCIFLIKPTLMPIFKIAPYSPTSS